VVVAGDGGAARTIPTPGKPASAGEHGVTSLANAVYVLHAFEAVCFPPAEAEHLRIRADHMIELTRIMEARQLTQAAMKVPRGTQPRISDLMPGRIDRFSIDTLVEMLTCAGADVTVRVRRGKHAAERALNPTDNPRIARGCTARSYTIPLQVNSSGVPTR